MSMFAGIHVLRCVDNMGCLPRASMLTFLLSLLPLLPLLSPPLSSTRLLQDVAKMTFYVRDARIRSKYHRAAGRVTASQRYYDKESGRVDVNEVDPFAKVASEAALSKELQKVKAAEKECYGEIRNAERETVEILDHRRREERETCLDKSVFETAREKSKEDPSAAEVNVEEVEVKDERQVDYLTPFLHVRPSI